MIELDLPTVRAKATELGVDYHPAMKAETIQALIDKHLDTLPPVIAPAVKDETPAERQVRMNKEALALLPITITSMDPQDASIASIAVSVGNKTLGQITKVIPFSQKWYMPKILIDELESKQFVRSSMVPIPGGQERLKTEMVRKYAILYHPMPTPDELAELAKAQLQGNEIAKSG